MSVADLARPTDQPVHHRPERTRLALGFIPLVDAAPLIVAERCGFFTAEGLDVALVREASWANIRDKVAVGALDGGHMLAPMLLATPRRVMVTGLALGRGDNGIVLGERLSKAPIGDVIAGAVTPPTFAVVFPYSVHTYLLRVWLTTNGVDPDQDVRIIVVPPPQMPQMLATGRIDGFCAGAPWPALAVARGAGRLAATGAQIAPTAPDKVLGVTADWADQHPATHQALIRAVIRAGIWADDPANRADLIELLADPDAVGVDASLLQPHAQAFHRHALPLTADADWLLAEMRAAGHLADAGAAAIVYRPDLYRQAAASLGLPV